MTELSDANYSDFLASAPRTVIKVWRDNCQPCADYAPIFEAVSKEFPGVPFGSFRLNNEPSSFKRKFMKTGRAVSSPLTIVFENGEPIEGALVEGGIDAELLRALVRDGKIPQEPAAPAAAPAAPTQGQPITQQQARLYQLYAQKGELVTSMELNQATLAQVNAEILRVLGRA